MADDVRPIDLSDLEPCGACRAMLRPTDEACVACGTPRGEAPAPDPGPAAPGGDERPRGRWWLAAIALALTAVSLVAGWRGEVLWFVVASAAMTIGLVVATRPGRPQTPEHSIPYAGWERTLTGPSATERMMIRGGLVFCIGLPVLAMVVDRPEHSSAVVAGATAIAAPLLAYLRRFLLEGDASGPRSTGVPL